MEADLNESCLADVTQAVGLDHFQLIQLVKEANQIAKETSSERLICFEILPGRSEAPIRVIRDSHWSTNWSKDTLQQYLADWRTREQDELDISLVSMIMQCSSEWNPLPGRVSMFLEDFVYCAERLKILCRKH